MGSNEPPERFPADRTPPARVRASEQAPLPPYSARWATGGRLAVVAIILLLIAAALAKITSRDAVQPGEGFSVRHENPQSGPAVR